MTTETDNTVAGIPAQPKKRSNVSKKLRFEVFKRDKFTCQYCGRTAPDVILQADHIHPKSKGGKNDILNLITSCIDCNLGKGARLISDDAAVKKQQHQAESIQERREQLEMLMEWQRSLFDLEDQTIRELADIWGRLTNTHPSDSGYSQLRLWVKRFGVVEVAEAMRVSTDSYLKYNPDTDLRTFESVVKAFQYIPRIIAGKKRDIDKPFLRDLYYARGILRNRLSYVNEGLSIKIMQDAYLAGLSTDAIKDIAKTTKNWTDFQTDLIAAVAALDGQE